jgi:hypothetical protein
MDETFDISKVAAAMANSNLDNLSLVVVPYALFTTTGRDGTQLNRNSLKIQGLQLLTAM